jgi:hypothetical protein
MQLSKIFASRGAGASLGWRPVLLAGSLLFLGAGLAHAQSSLGLGNPEPGSQPSSFVPLYMPWLQPVLTFINVKQQEFYRH